MKNKYIFFIEELEKIFFKKSKILSKVCINFVLYLQVEFYFVSLIY